MTKLGRPKDLIPKDQVIKARASDETKQRFEYIADRLGVSQSDLLRGLIDGAFAHLNLVSQVPIAEWNTEQHQAFYRGHVFRMWETLRLYAEAAIRVGLLDEWEQITKEYFEVVQEINQHGRLLSPEEKALSADEKGEAMT